MGNGNFHALHCYVFRYYYNVIFAQHIFIYIQLNLTALKWFLWFMVFNATFNNISVISWRSVLLVEETGENHQHVASHWQILSHIVVSSTRRLSGVWTHNVSGDRHWLHRYHMIMATMAPTKKESDIPEIVKIEGCWIITGLQCNSCRQKLYRELGWESLENYRRNKHTHIIL
jgi:hypothetical protein